VNVIGIAVALWARAPLNCIPIMIAKIIINIATATRVLLRIFA
jgi:hypothetical protein